MKINFIFWSLVMLVINIYIYIYIYKTETFETPTNFHVSTILKKIINK